MQTNLKASFGVEPFNGQNDFTLWQQRVRNILTREGTVKALKKKSEKPATLIDDAWQDMRDPATSTIQLYLADNTLREVINLIDLEEVWTKLESRYKSKSLTNRLYLKKKLYSLRLSESGDFEKHLDEFNRILTELAALGVKTDEDKTSVSMLEEEDKALLLLSSLPDSYDNIVTTLLFGKDTLVFDEVIASLLMYETRRKSNNGGSSGEGSALAMTGGRSNRGRSVERKNGFQRGRSRSKSRGDFNCWKCGKYGHIKRNCPDWNESQDKRKEKEKGKQKVEESSDQTAIVEDDKYYSEVMLITEAGTDGPDWILDSGCSFHMCAAREQFDTYKECDGGTVRMANKAESRVAGVGTVRVRMFDGVVRTLADVKHVPDLRMNLISLGTLDSRGYRISAGGGVLKVSQGAMVVMKGQMIGNLYRLIGSVKTGGDPVRSQVADTGGEQTVKSVMSSEKKRVTFASVVRGNLSGCDRVAARREVEPRRAIQRW